MYILKIKAFADFDMSYDINLAVFSNSLQANYVRDALNDWVNKQDKVNQDVRFSEIVKDDDLHNDFLLVVTSALANWFNRNQIASFVTNYFEVIRNNYVYLNTNIFSVENVQNLTDLGGQNYGI